MTSSLVGSEMCIRDRLYTDRFMLDEESGRWWRLRDPDMAAAGAMAAPDIIDYMREF